MSLCESLCRSECRKGAFRCKTGVCVHEEALGDGQVDCLDGDDESVTPAHSKTLLMVTSQECELVMCSHAASAVVFLSFQMC